MLNLSKMLKELRTYGWTVAVHNDYRLKGELRTFWLFTHQASGTFLKGEGSTDEWAVKDILDQWTARHSRETAILSRQKR